MKKNEQVIGIVCLDSLLEEYKSGDISDTHVAEYLEPLFFVNEYEDRSLARSLMKENNVEHIAVTNQDGIFLGIASAKEFKEEP